jgi:hypothetical protein
MRKLWPRLLLLALIASGALLWKSGRFVQSRELDWQMGADSFSIREVEIQIWNEDAKLLKREVFFFPDGAPSQIAQKVTLSDGNYLARVFVKRAAQGRAEQYTQMLQVSREALVLSLRDPGRREPGGPR